MPHLMIRLLLSPVSVSWKFWPLSRSLKGTGSPAAFPQANVRGWNLKRVLQMPRFFFCSLLLLLSFAWWPGERTHAQESAVNFAAPGQVEPVSETRHEIKIGAKAIKYTARAGRLPIRDNQAGEAHGYMFFVAYLADRLPGEPVRPLTFLWNGGPGSNSALVHLSGFGPKRIPLEEKWTPQGESSRVILTCVDNQETWLDQTDLVFVDPIGTGFSRPAKPEFAQEFYNTLGDIASVAEFVRVYLTRFDAWSAPLFVGGESYGVWRAAGVAELLIKRSQKVAGVIFISGGLPVGKVLSDEMRTALFVPTRTAAAFYHRKLPPDLQGDLASTLKKSEAWALSEYAPALSKLDELTEADRQSLQENLARFTGLPSSYIDPKTLVVGRQQFAEQLLRERKQVLARFDTRKTIAKDSRDIREADQDGAYKTLVNKYLRGTLQFPTDLAYTGIEEGYSPTTAGKVRSAGERWDYNQGVAQARVAPTDTDSPPGGPQPWLRRSLESQRDLKVFVAAGLYDSLNSCAGLTQTAARMPADLGRNIMVKCYDGGHMMYESPGARRQLKGDIGQFYRQTLGAAKATPGR